MLTENKKIKNPEDKSRLIRVIKRLYNLSEHSEIRNCQKQLTRMKNCHSVFSHPARLELIADLIAEKKGLINRRERKALERISKGIIK